MQRRTRSKLGCRDWTHGRVPAVLVTPINPNGSGAGCHPPLMSPGEGIEITEDDIKVPLKAKPIAASSEEDQPLWNRKAPQVGGHAAMWSNWRQLFSDAMMIVWTQCMITRTCESVAQVFQREKKKASTSRERGMSSEKCGTSTSGPECSQFRV